MKRVQVYSYTEFPNHIKTLKQKLIDSIIGFDKPAVSSEPEPDEMTPEMLNVLDRIDQQDVRMQKMFDILKEQSELLKEISRRKQESNQKKKEEAKESSKMGLFGF
ncbi:uncharacterized protein LOC144640038 [Oculina patagonica]